MRKRRREGIGHNRATPAGQQPHTTVSSNVASRAQSPLATHPLFLEPPVAQPPDGPPRHLLHLPNARTSPTPVSRCRVCCSSWRLCWPSRPCPGECAMREAAARAFPGCSAGLRRRSGGGGIQAASGGGHPASRQLPPAHLPLGPSSPCSAAPPQVPQMCFWTPSRASPALVRVCLAGPSRRWRRRRRSRTCPPLPRRHSGPADARAQFWTASSGCSPDHAQCSACALEGALDINHPPPPASTHPPTHPPLPHPLSARPSPRRPQDEADRRGVLPVWRQ